MKIKFKYTFNKDDNYEIEMFSNQMISYGEITQELTSIMKILLSYIIKNSKER